jgi:hypothetical protein
MKHLKVFGAWFATCLAWALIVSMAALLHGVAAMLLWNWFVAPVGVGTVGLVQAAGICLPILCLTEHYHDFKHFESDLSIRPLIYLFLRPGLYLGLGWILHLWM